MNELDDWWQDLTAAALVGTGRRPPPPAPPWPVVARDDASREVLLLDAVALGGALRRAGGTRAIGPDDGGAVAPAPPDALPLAPARARQLLDLLLGQSPVGPALRPLLLRLWLDTAADHGVRVHHATLVPLLTLGSGNRALRDAVRPVLDHRGAWLAALNPREWAWVARTPSTATTTVDPVAWARLPTDQRAVQARRLRALDPAAARALLESTWGSDPAPARATLVVVLEVGLGPDDERFLEAALDDRAAGVRAAAAPLLDGLPGSARADRMAARLTPLLSTSGLLRRTLTVELPEAPDAAGVRDGLGRAARGQSERGLWLQRIVAGAPLAVWSDATGLTPHAVVTALVRERATDALTGLRRAALLRADLDWARAVLDHGWDGLLAALLPDAERADRMRRRVAEVTSYGDLLGALRLLPGPWPAEVGEAVVQRLGTIAAHGGRGHELAELVPVLAAALHPGAAGAVQRLADRGDPGSDHLHHLAQHLALVPTITEAFA